MAAANMQRSALVKGIRELIGDQYYPDERRGAKTNELGLTKSQVIRLASEIADFMEGANHD